MFSIVAAGDASKMANTWWCQCILLFLTFLTVFAVNCGYECEQIESIWFHISFVPLVDMCFKTYKHHQTNTALNNHRSRNKTSALSLKKKTVKTHRETHRHENHRRDRTEPTDKTWGDDLCFVLRWEKSTLSISKTSGVMFYPLSTGRVSWIFWTTEKQVERQEICWKGVKLL